MKNDTGQKRKVCGGQMSGKASRGKRRCCGWWMKHKWKPEPPPAQAILKGVHTSRRLCSEEPEGGSWKLLQDRGMPCIRPVYQSLFHYWDKIYNTHSVRKRGLFWLKLSVHVYLAPVHVCLVQGRNFMVGGHGQRKPAHLQGSQEATCEGRSPKERIWGQDMSFLSLPSGTLTS